MRTSLNIPEDLLEEATRVAKVATKTQAIVLALTEFIQRRSSVRILELKGSLKDEPESYKKAREKR